MKVIWKYPLDSRVSLIEMPRGSKIVSVQLQGRVPTLWAIVDPQAPTVAVRVAILATGEQFEDDVASQYAGTFQEDPYVWHVFAKDEA